MLLWFLGQQDSTYSDRQYKEVRDEHGGLTLRVTYAASVRDLNSS